MAMAQEKLSDRYSKRGMSSLETKCTKCELGWFCADVETCTNPNHLRRCKHCGCFMKKPVKVGRITW